MHDKRMKKQNSPPGHEIPMWAGLIVALLLYSYIIATISATLLGHNEYGGRLDYESHHVSYYKTMIYLQQTKDRPLGFRGNEDQQVIPTLRKDRNELRKALQDLAYSERSAKDTIHGFVIQIPLAWFIPISSLCICASLFASMFGALLLRTERLRIRTRGRRLDGWGRAILHWLFTTDAVADLGRPRIERFHFSPGMR